MRLIDADAFDKVLEDAEIEATRNRKYVFRSALNTIRGNLRNAPTIEERKKGKWDDIGGVIRYGCPFCHNAQERKSNFCLNCGADMRGTP